MASFLLFFVLVLGSPLLAKSQADVIAPAAPPIAEQALALPMVATPPLAPVSGVPSAVSVKPFGLHKSVHARNLVAGDRNPFSKFTAESQPQALPEADPNHKAPPVDPLKLLHMEEDALSQLLNDKLTATSTGNWISLGDIFWSVGEDMAADDLGLQGVATKLTSVTDTRLYFTLTDLMNNSTDEFGFSLDRFSKATKPKPQPLKK